MASIAAIWATYLSCIGLIYKIGEKAPNFLDDDSLNQIGRYARTDPVTRTLGIFLLYLTITIDRLLKFHRQGRGIYVPSLWRSASLSVAMLCLIAFPFPWAFFIILPIPGVPIFLWEMIRYSPLFGMVMIFNFLCCNVISDYISFCKSRTLIEKFKFFRSPYRELLIILSEIALIPLICVFASGFVTILISILLPLFSPDGLIPTLFARSVLFLVVDLVLLAISFGAAIYVVVRKIRSTLLRLIVLLPALTCILGFIFGAIPAWWYGEASFSEGFLSVLDLGFLFILSAVIAPLITSLGIGACSIFLALVQIMAWPIKRMELRGMWVHLDFENKPTFAAAVVAIVVFSVVYWPVILIVRFS